MVTLLLTVGFLILAVFFKLIPLLYKIYAFRNMLNKIPAPPQVPLFGITFEAMRLKQDDRLWYFHNLSLRFKDGFYSSYVMFNGIVNFSSPKHLEIILTSTENIQKGPIYDFIRPWLGEGLVTSTGEQWFHSRKLLTPAFHFNILAEFAPIIWQKAEILVTCIDKELKKKPGQFIGIFNFTVKAALDVLCETAMGINMHVQNESDIEYVKALHNVSALSVNRLFCPWLYLDFVYFATSYGKMLKENIDQMHKVTRDIIRKRKEERKEQNNRSADTSTDGSNIGSKKRRAMLDLLLDASQISEQPLTDDQIKEQVDTFLFADHDTTAAAITWSLFCLGNNPDCQEKVHQELEAVFGDSKKPPTLKELSELKYLERVIKEVLRLYPSVPFITRTVTKEMVVDGYKIPVGAIANIALFSTHRHPDIWPDPLKFDPDRFLPENSKNRHPYAYIPFSAGPRNCIGQRFALMILKIMLTAILKKWRVKSVLDHHQIKICSLFILKPCDDINLYFIEK